MHINIINIASPLHDEQALNHTLQQLLQHVNAHHSIIAPQQANDADNNQRPTILYIATGGTENIARHILSEQLTDTAQPIWLLTSQQNNSLPATLEILAWCNSHKRKAEIIYGTPADIAQRIDNIGRCAEARQQWATQRMAVIGQPSDWLIASDYNAETIHSKIGATVVDIPINELFAALQGITDEQCHNDIDNNAWLTPHTTMKQQWHATLVDATRIYLALKALIQQHRLTALTLRCFDLLDTIHNTGCWALARLNAEGIIAACEGDVPAMLSMMMAQTLTKQTGFMANPSTIDYEKTQITFAHCTVPLNMVNAFSFDTHFESGIGIGIRGQMTEGDITLLKVNGDLSQHYIAEGQLTANTCSPQRCRTQTVIQLKNQQQLQQLIDHPIGNHHIILNGHHQALLQQALALLK